MERKNVVLVKHPNDKEKYIFKVPDGKSLDAGDRVLCNTIRGHGQMGICITNSFPILEVQLKEWYGFSFNQLKPVVGILRPVMWVYEGERNAED